VGGAPFAPEKGFVLSAVAEECSSTALFFVQCLGMPMRTGSRGTMRHKTAHFAGDLEVKTGEISISFPLNLPLGIWCCGISGWLGFVFPFSFFN
jgi:hypothetical protein